MKAVTLKYTVQTVNEWRAGYSESCKSGSGASVRKPTAAMRQGAGYLAYSMRSISRITGTTTPTSGATMRSAVPATGSVKNTACPSSFPAVTRARATLSTRRNRTVPATRQSCVPPSTGSCPAASAWRICSAASSGKGTN